MKRIKKKRIIGIFIMGFGILFALLKDVSPIFVFFLLMSLLVGGYFMWTQR